MNNLIRKVMGLFSEKHRHEIYRRMTVVPNKFLNPDLQVEIASTVEDLQSAYKLLHDCYVGIGIIDPQPSGLRCNFFSFLPTSTVIVAKLHGQVIGTVSTIKDSRLGLPCDREFPVENNCLRQHGKSLVEVSALAVAPEHRGNHSVSLLLMAFVYQHCANYFCSDTIVAAVHPRSEDFYKALMGFERNGKPLQYSTLKGAAAIHISMDLSAEHMNKITKNFRSMDRMRNMGVLLRHPDSRFQFAKKTPGLQINPVLTPDMLRYFCLQQKEVWSRISPQDRQTLIQVYTTYFGVKKLQEFLALEPNLSATQSYRTPVQLTSIAKFMGQINFCKISDLASGGCFVSSDGSLPHPGEKVWISFRLDQKDYLLQGFAVWNSESQSLTHSRGFGLRFESLVPMLNQHLQKWAYSASQVQSRRRRHSDLEASDVAK